MFLRIGVTVRSAPIAARVLLAAGLGQPALLLVAAGAAYQAFTRDVPEAPNRAVKVYYVLLLGALASLLVGRFHLVRSGFVLSLDLA